MEQKIKNTPIPAIQFKKYTPTPYFECTPKGIFYHAISTDKNGQIQENAPLHLSDPIKLIGQGIDQDGNHYRLITIKNKLTNRPQTHALKMETIGSNWGELQRLGITIYAGRKKRDHLTDYLQTEGDKTHYTITDRAGWHDKSYILPSGEILSQETNPNIYYNGDKSQQNAYQAKGTLEDWRQEIALYANENSRLSLAIGIASPLAHLLDMEGGGIHLYGDSSDGKTTLAKIALSVWGNPEKLKLTWEGTHLGFSNIACARNDNLLILDEIGQASPRTISQTTYAIMNGVSKIQGAKEGGNRTIKQWRILTLSTGEKALQDYSKQQGITWQAGQNNRLPSLPANPNKGHGVYDTLHDKTTGAELSEHLTEKAQQQHGTAGRAFIENLLKNPEQTKKTIQQHINTFCAEYPTLTGQTRRVCKRFALIYSALELANTWQIINHSNPKETIQQTFNDWLETNGADKYEDQHIIENAENWLQKHADSVRLAYWDERTTDKDHAGYKRYTYHELHQAHPQQKEDCLETEQEYWIIASVFEEEICQNYNKTKVCQILSAIGWLKTSFESNGKKRYKNKKHKQGWFYVLKGRTPPEQTQ